MKKSILVLAALAATVVLAGCSACKAPENTAVYTSGTTTTTTTTKVKKHHRSDLKASREDVKQENTSN